MDNTVHLQDNIQDFPEGNNRLSREDRIGKLVQIEASMVLNIGQSVCLFVSGRLDCWIDNDMIAKRERFDNW